MLSPTGCQDLYGMALLVVLLLELQGRPKGAKRSFQLLAPLENTNPCIENYNTHTYFVLFDFSLINLSHNNKYLVYVGGPFRHLVQSTYYWN